ncbi:MAG: hypothetical protein ACREXS_10525 [Gammaproteobacteria bacterium]
MRVILQVMALGFAIAGMGLSASADETTLPSAESATTAAPKAPPSKSESSKAKQKSAPPAKPAESRTPEEASARAADRKDPSGALIIKTPGAAGAKP